MADIHKELYEHLKSIEYVLGVIYSDDDNKLGMFNMAIKDSMCRTTNLRQRLDSYIVNNKELT